MTDDDRKRISAADYLKAQRMALRDDASDLAMERMKGAIEALRSTGAITDMEAVGWLAVIERCPGHECSRVWCAYCGTIDPEHNDPDGPGDRRMTDESALLADYVARIAQLTAERDEALLKGRRHRVRGDD